MNKRMTAATATVLGLGLLAGCSSGGSSSNSSSTPRGVPKDVGAKLAKTSYHPKINPADFSTNITNPYFPLPPGTTFIFEGTKAGTPQHTEVTVTHDTKLIDGVTTVVVHDVVSDPTGVIEDTYDWYAQNKDGTVWYFGEAVKDYDHGVLTATTGSWVGGVDGAQPGIIMPAHPVVNKTYRHEYAREAQDMSTVLRLDGSSTVYGTYNNNVIITVDFTPLEPDKIENKHFAPGVGFIYGKMSLDALEVRLVEIRHS